MARPKGYAAWNPKPQTLAVIENVQAILDDYSAYLPLTVRQIFYRLVGAYDYPKHERAYNNLANYLVRARRARLIPFHAIRDDGTVREGGGGYRSEESFWQAIRRHGERFSRNTLEPQSVAIELWCEAAGMVPQLASAVDRYSVPVYSTGGFSSVTVTHEIAERASRAGKPTVFLHVGDYDPSGESIFEAMSDDAEQFTWRTGGSIEAVRVALTREQVQQYDLPTAPAKTSDTRSVNWDDDTCQLEAMAPDQIAQLVVEAIEEWIDLDLLIETEAEEAEQRESIIAEFDRIEAERGD